MEKTTPKFDLYMIGKDEEPDLVERLESHAGKQDFTVLLRDCRLAAKEIRRLRNPSPSKDNMT